MREHIWVEVEQKTRTRYIVFCDECEDVDMIYFRALVKRFAGEESDKKITKEINKYLSKHPEKKYRCEVVDSMAAFYKER